MPRTPMDPPPAGRDPWRGLYRAGAVAAIAVIACTVLDIVLTMAPGFGPDSVPADVAGWFAQLDSHPLVALRNLDLLNVCVSVISLPLYAALLVAHRRVAPAPALNAFALVLFGTALFATANAALPMLSLAERYAAMSSAAARAPLAGAAEALLARGAHDSYGAFPGFALSELGTLLMAVAMLRGGVFGRTAGWTGIVGMAVMLGYSVAYTFGSASDALITGIAAPAGLLMLAWYVLAARRLLQMEASHA